MNNTPFPQSLAGRWKEEFAEFLCMTIAMWCLRRNQLESQPIRRTMLLRAVSLAAMAEHLEGHELLPHEMLEWPEAEIWAQARELAQDVRWFVPPAGVPADELLDDLAAMDAAWDRWAGFLGSLPDGFCRECRSLRPGTEPGDRIVEGDGSGAVPTAIVG